ncbi:hypothetical protein DPMN_192440 [Dreissena polymorpha]|uniref:Uncharacterized protein n=1 Tax=Dreissena polymorpha TaxID=45954 RepID=A0A9D3Y4Q0_DREPO|nr:hypothetical protein DPMN_192440 [Dreissena polymorpha]
MEDYDQSTPEGNECIRKFPTVFTKHVLNFREIASDGKKYPYLQYFVFENVFEVSGQVECNFSPTELSYKYVSMGSFANNMKLVQKSVCFYVSESRRQRENAIDDD